MKPNCPNCGNTNPDHKIVEPRDSYTGDKIDCPDCGGKFKFINGTWNRR